MCSILAAISSEFYHFPQDEREIDQLCMRSCSVVREEGSFPARIEEFAHIAGHGFQCHLAGASVCLG